MVMTAAVRDAGTRAEVLRELTRRIQADRDRGDIFTDLSPFDCCGLSILE